MPKSENLSIGFLFDDTLDSSDGVAQYVKNLGRWLDGQGHRVFYVVGETKIKSWAGGRVYSPAKNLKTFFNGNRVSTPLPASRRRIYEILAKEKPDVLHVQVPYSPFLAGRVISAAAPGTAVIGTFHIYPSGKLTIFGSKLLWVFCIRTLRRFDLILAVSQPAADFARRAFGVKSAPGSNMVELVTFKAARTSPQRYHIVFLGRLVKRKGARELLEAFFILHSKMPMAKLTIAGDGPQRSKLERLVKQRRLEQSVKFLGFIEEKDKPGILASAAIACFPSTGGESFGIVLIEAMAAGAGVVLGGDNPGYRSVLGKRPECLVNPSVTAEFVAKLELFLTNRALANEIHDWQQDLVKKYDVEIVGPQILSLYRRAIAKRNQSRHN